MLWKLSELKEREQDGWLVFGGAEGCRSPLLSCVTPLSLGKGPVPGTVSGLGVQCVALKGCWSKACLRSPSREPGCLFFQCLPDVVRSLTGEGVITFTSKVTSFPESPDSAHVTSSVTDTALHVISPLIWMTRNLDQQLVCFLSTDAI